MSRNHYTKQLPLLEAQLHSKLQEVAVLEKEHQRLQHKEYALHNAIHSIQGPLALVKSCVGDSIAGTASTAAASAHTDCTPDDGPSGSSRTHSCSDSSNHTEPCSAQAASVLFEKRGCVSGPVPGLAAASFRDSTAILQQLSHCEDRVQSVLQQLGGCDDAGYTQLYTTQLLQRATMDPARMAAYLNTTRPQRLSLWSYTDARLALLLGKYDANLGLATGGPYAPGGPRQQVDTLVDELFERIVVCSMLDPPSKHMSCFMINVDTQEFEPYPEGWWKQVLEGVGLTAIDKAALKLVWDRVKVNTQQLTEQYEQLQAQLHELHRQQVVRNREFEQRLQELPSLLHAMEVAGRTRLEFKQQQQQHHHHHHQQQQQQQYKQQQQPAGQPSWICEAPDTQAAADAVADLLMQELVSQVADNKQLEHLLQHLDTPSTHTSAADTAGGATCCSEPAWSNGQQQQQQPWGQVGSNMRCPPDPAAAAAAGGQAPGQWPTTTTLQPDCSTLQCQGSTLNQASAAAGLDQGSAAGLDQGAAAGLDQGAAAGLDQRSFTGVVPPTYMQTSLCEGEEALLQDGTWERQHLEQQMEACTNKLKVLHYCLVLQVTNTLTKKQLAAMCVHSHPFVFDVHSMCEVLDAAGWGV